MLYFVRHGESEANIKGVFAGQRDDSLLTDRGKIQAKELATKINEDQLFIDKIVASPLERAKNTANIIAECIGFDINNIIIDERITEYDMGDITGTPISEISSKKLISAKNAEDVEIFKRRVIQCILDLSSPLENVLIVSHAGVGRLLETVKQNINPQLFYDLKAYHNASITTIDWIKKL